MASKKTIGELVYKIVGDGKGLGVALAKSEKQLKKFNKSFGVSNKKSIATLAGLGVSVAGVGILLASATKKAIAFEATIADLKTLIGDDAAGVKKLEKGIKKLSRTMPKSGEELGSAAYNILSAGITDATEALEVLEQSGKLAVAGLGSTTDAVNLVTSAINAFEIDASDSASTANILFTTVKMGKTTVAELAQSFGNVAAAAKGANVSFEETQAATAALTVVGFRTATAQDRLRALFDEMTRSSGKLNDSYDLLGQGSIATAVKTDGFKTVLDELLGSVNGDTVAFKNMFSSVEAGGAALALVTGASDVYNESLEQMTGNTDLLTSAFSEQADTTESRLIKVQNEMNLLLIALGDKILPTLNEALKDISETMDLFVGGGEAVEAYNDTIKKLDNQINELNEEYEKINEGTSDFTNGQVAAAKSAVENTKAIARQQKMVDLLNEAYGMGSKKNEALVKISKEYGDVIEGLVVLNDQAYVSSENLDTAYEKQLNLLSGLKTATQLQDKEALAPFIKRAEKAVISEKNLATSIKEEEEARKASQKATEEARKTLEGFQGKMVDLVESSRALSAELKENLVESLKKFGTDIIGNVGESQKQLATIVINAEEKKKSLLEQLANEEDADRRASLQKELDEQEAVLQARVGFEERQAKTIEDIRQRLAEAGIDVELGGLDDVMTLDEQVAEQRRIMDLDEFSRFEEQQTAKLLRLADDFLNERDIIVKKIELQKGYEQELTDFLVDTNVVRTEALDTWAESAINSYGRVANELKSLLSLQSRLGSVTSPPFSASEVSGASSSGSSSVDNSKTINANNTFNVTTNDEADLSALSKELGFELSSL